MGPPRKIAYYHGNRCNTSQYDHHPGGGGRARRLLWSNEKILSPKGLGHVNTLGGGGRGSAEFETEPSQSGKMFLRGKDANRSLRLLRGKRFVCIDTENAIKSSVLRKQGEGRRKIKEERLLYSHRELRSNQTGENL